MADARTGQIKLRTQTLSTRHSNHEGNFPSFQKPTVKGYFSVDGDRNAQADLSHLKYIHNPSGRVEFDLNHGIDKGVKKDETVDEKLDKVLWWMLSNQPHIKDPIGKEKCFQADFVCFRGLLSMLMCTPYESQEGWIICATKWQNTIYLCASETEEKRRSRECATDRQKQFMAWGYKFEQYMTKDKTSSMPDIHSPVNEREELCVTFQTRLSGHYVLFGAEMDGIQSNTIVNNLEELSKAEFVELKTSRHIQSGKQNYSFQRYKLIKWWCQSFLVGIKQVICGFRDDYGMVNELQEFSVKEMPKMAEGLWNPCVCMNFCANFLSFAKSVVIEKTPNTVWKFERQPRSEEVTFVEIPGPSEYTFLPAWFIRETSTHEIRTA